MFCSLQMGFASILATLEYDALLLYPTVIAVERMAEPVDEPGGGFSRCIWHGLAWIRAAK
jgi:hypothetical protein